MKTKSLLCIIGAVFCLATAGLAQTTDGSMLFTPSINLSAGAQNSFAGSVGGIFLTTGTLWPYVNWLGYYDKDGDGLANSHEVSLWLTGGVGVDSYGDTVHEVAHATVPAGTAAPLVNGYRWVQIPQVGLWYGSWYTIAAQTDGVDTWGDLITGDSAQITWNTEYVGNNGGWSRAGRYDWPWTWPNSPANQVGNDAIYPAPNLAFNLTVPEPASWTLLGVGLAAYFGVLRRQRR